jgi:hypothetical protein
LKSPFDHSIACSSQHSIFDQAFISLPLPLLTFVDFFAAAAQFPDQVHQSSCHKKQTMPHSIE